MLDVHARRDISSSARMNWRDEEFFALSHRHCLVAVVIFAEVEERRRGPFICRRMKLILVNLYSRKLNKADVSMKKSQTLQDKRKNIRKK